MYHPEKRAVLLQHRDAKAPTNPNKWALFGGVGEADETPEQCLRRELKEELGYDFSDTLFEPLHDYVVEHLKMRRYVFFAVVDFEKEACALNEGQGFEWVALTDALKLDLSGAATRRDIEAFLLLILRRDGNDKVFAWNAEPGEEDLPHEHPFDTQIIVFEGSITIGQAGADRILETGDAIFIPRGTRHWAKVGASGCRYLVAEKH